MQPLVQVTSVEKTFNARRADEFRALAGVSLEIGRGEVVVLKGPSGSGKTTLLALLGCMSRPTAGSILVNGRDVVKLPESFLTRIRRQTFGFIFQQFNLVRELTALENVLLPLYPQDIRIGEMAARGRQLLGRFGLEAKERVKVSRLSGGEQQRVAIARALVNEPEVVIADEPTAHLDSRLSLELLGILNEINRGGRTVIIATHDPLVFAHPMVSQLLVMRDGRIEETIRK